MKGDVRKVQNLILPLPKNRESPSRFAERIGEVYSENSSAEYKKKLGQFLTPLKVAQFMASQSEVSASKVIRILDPGAGAGVLSCAILEELALHKKTKKIVLDAYEIDTTLTNCLKRSLTYAKSWLKNREANLEFRVFHDDFVLSNASFLDTSLQLFETPLANKDGFDVIISNPPYFKIPITDPRAKAAATVVRGQPNLYAIFMAVSAALLREEGELIFITPRSYSAGPYFQLFREHFFEKMLPKKIHLFDSRKDAFNKDQVLQENVILHAKKESNWTKNSLNGSVQISVSAGLSDLDSLNRRLVPIKSVLDSRVKGKVLRIPVGDRHDEVSRIVNSWSGNLKKYGLQISTGPIVPFRAEHFLFYSGMVPEKHCPLLWMQNVKSMSVEWPKQNINKPQYVIANEPSRSILVPNKNYVLLRRFSAKEQHRRLTAAPYIHKMFTSSCLGLENHLNYIHRPNGKLNPEETYGLAALLNSALLDEYFRISNGNTQVSATELRAMPFPPLEDITNLGKTILSEKVSFNDLDDLISEILNCGAGFNTKVSGVVNA